MFEFITNMLPYGEYIDFALIIVLFLVIAKIASSIFKRSLHRLTAKTQTTLDDLIIKAVNTPLLIGIFIFGVYYSILDSVLLAVYTKQLSLGFTIFYIFLIAIVIIRVINAVIEWYMDTVAKRTHTKKDEQFLPIIKKVAYGVVGMLALFWILNQMGIEITTLVAAMGIGGIAIALALQDTLKEFFAGTYMIVDRPIRIGDFIEIDSGDKGTIVDIGWRSTRIRTFTNNFVIIPNSKLSASKITNYNTPDNKIGFSIEVGVGYGEDLEKVEKVTLDVAKKLLKKMDRSPKEFEPFIRYQGFGDSNIDFKIIMKANTYGDQFLIKHEFIKALKKEYDKQGIEISWPVRKVYNYNAKKW